MSIEVTTITMPQRMIYGMRGNSSDKAISKDIPSLSKKYYDAIGKPSGSVLPFFVLSHNYSETTKQFDLFIGGQTEHGQLEEYELPEGIYGKITVKPKFGFVWNLAIGEAKRYFYIKWLPASGYSALNMEYELHSEKSIAKKPEIDLLFAISKR